MVRYPMAHARPTVFRALLSAVWRAWFGKKRRCRRPGRNTEGRESVDASFALRRRQLVVLLLERNVGLVGVEKRLALPLRSGDLLPCWIEVIPGPGAIFGVLLDPDGCAVGLLVTLLADPAASLEVQRPHELSVGVEESLGAVEEGAAIGG